MTSNTFLPTSHRRPENLTFSVTQKGKPGRLKLEIIHAFLAVREMPSTRMDFIIEDGNIYQLFHDKSNEIEFNIETWTWKALISFQIHKDSEGKKICYAVARPFRPNPPEPFFSLACKQNLQGV